MLSILVTLVSLLILFIVLLGLFDLALFLYRKVKDKVTSLFRRNSIDMQEVKADVPAIIQQQLDHKRKAR